MSLVYITHHDENIYNVERGQTTVDPKASLVETRQQQVIKKKYDPKEYHSQHKYGKWLRAKLEVEYKKHQIINLKNNEKLVTTAQKCKHRTMGCAHTPVNPPCAYLRKHQGIKWKRENDHVCPPPRHMPAVPRCCPKVAPRGRSQDFVKLNIDKIKAAAPKRTPPRYVDTPIGTRHNVINSGLIPQFICRKDFGKTPVYLSHIKDMLADVRGRCRKSDDKKVMLEVCRSVSRAADFATDSEQLAGVRRMQQQERDEILAGLKKYYSEVTKKYQSMSLYTDTPSKQLRKAKLESDLRQLEQDISLMEKSPIIYVSDV